MVSVFLVWKLAGYKFQTLPIFNHGNGMVSTDFHSVLGDSSAKPSFSPGMVGMVMSMS